MKVGALCIKKEGAHFDTPSSFFYQHTSFRLFTTEDTEVIIISKLELCVLRVLCGEIVHL